MPYHSSVYAGEYKGALKWMSSRTFFGSPPLGKVFYDSFWKKQIMAITGIPQCRSKNFFGKSDGNIFLEW
jgi:hypothetical protein